MTWTYSGDPASSLRDEVRFLIGDTDTSDQLVLDEEIAWALTEYSNDTRLAGAVCLRGLASKFSRFVNRSVGSVSASASDQSKAYAERANELDPSGLTKPKALCLPSFGGRSISEKETLSEDSDAVQPSFYRGQDDIPGGWPDGESDDPDWIR